MLLRVRIRGGADKAAGDAGRALASVRLHFRDPADSGVERVQEVVARYQVTTESARVEAAANDRTRTIAATQQAAQITAAAAVQVNDGRVDAADQQLAAAENKLREAAARAKNEEDKKRVIATAAKISSVRAAAKKPAAPGAPAAAPPRANALKLNHAVMDAYGF
jgi:Ca-activated chloride channel family protein